MSKNKYKGWLGVGGQGCLMNKNELMTVATERTKEKGEKVTDSKKKLKKK